MNWRVTWLQNHAKVKKLETELRELYGRIADVLESYTDEPDESAP